MVLGLALAIGGAAATVSAQDAAVLASCVGTPNSDGCTAGLPSAHYQVLLDEMLMMPDPNVHPLPPNDTQLDRFQFRKLVNENGTVIYDAPNGGQIGFLDPGFNFVSVTTIQDGWVQINPGQWVSESDTSYYRPSSFAGVLLPEEGLRYTMAWVLVSSHPTPYPGGEEDTERARITRYTRVNIYEEVELDGWRWYLIAPDTWIKQTKVAKIVFTSRPDEIKGRWVGVDLYEQVMVAYDENDLPVYATLVSSGLPEWSTNEGTFQTWARIANGSMSGAEGQTDFYSLENVPWTLYFDNDISLHGAYWHDGFGYRRSHGCVNLSITDSYWLYQWTLDGGYDHPYVHVFSSGEYLAS